MSSKTSVFMADDRVGRKNVYIILDLNFIDDLQPDHESTLVKEVSIS
jgi:hypothetical protein